MGTGVDQFWDNSIFFSSMWILFIALIVVCIGEMMVVMIILAGLLGGVLFEFGVALFDDVIELALAVGLPHGTEIKCEYIIILRRRGVCYAIKSLHLFPIQIKHGKDRAVIIRNTLHSSSLIHC